MDRYFGVKEMDSTEYSGSSRTISHPPDELGFGTTVSIATEDALSKAALSVSVSVSVSVRVSVGRCRCVDVAVQEVGQDKEYMVRRKSTQIYVIITD